MRFNFTYLLFALGFLLTSNTFACSCAPKKLAKAQQSELEKSECIFVGEVIGIKDDLYTIRVIESLDGGDLPGNTYIGQNWRYCTPYVDEKGFWLVYASTEGGFLKMNICGISRSFSKPFAPTSGLYKFEDNPNMTIEESFSELLKIHRLDLADEINALRKRRDYIKKPAGNNGYN